MSNVRDKVYVSLDCLFDVELAIMEQHLPSDKLMAFMPEYLESKYSRCAVLKGLIDKEKFEKHWYGRNKKDLSMAGGTKMISYFSELIKEFDNHLTSNPNEKNIHIVIDTFPYNLTSYDLNMMRSGFEIRWGITAEFSFINQGESELTLGRLANYRSAYVRSFDDWFTAHGRKLAKFDTSKLFDTKLFVPPLLLRDDFETLAEDPIVDQNYLRKNDPLEEVKQRLAGMLNIEYVSQRMWRVN